MQTLNFPTRPVLAHRINIPRPYTPSYATDIRHTFEHARERLGANRPVTLVVMQRDRRAP